MLNGLFMYAIKEFFFFYHLYINNLQIIIFFNQSWPKNTNYYTAKLTYTVGHSWLSNCDWEEAWERGFLPRILLHLDAAFSNDDVIFRSPSSKAACKVWWENNCGFSKAFVANVAEWSICKISFGSHEL